MTLWFIAIGGYNGSLYHCYPSSRKYIYDGSEEDAQKMFAILLIKYINNKSDSKQTIREYISCELEYSDELLSDFEINQYLQNKCHVNNLSEEYLMGYVKFDDIKNTDWFDEIELTDGIKLTWITQNLNEFNFDKIYM